MSTNELSVEITQEKDDAVMLVLDNLQGELDFLRDLSAKGRQRLVKMGRSNVDFVKRCYRHADGSPQFIPNYMPIEEFKKDMDFADWLRIIEKKLNHLANMVSDTAMLAESEAYKASRLYYNSVKAAAKNGKEEAELIFKDLSVHFKRQTNSNGETPTEPEEPQEPPVQWQ